MGMPCARFVATVTILGLAAVAPLWAGTINLEWDPVADAAGYRVYFGTSSGLYTQNVSVVGSTRAAISGLADCTTWYLAVKAYNTAGESPAYSNEVIGWPRPEIAAVTPNARMQGEQFTVEVTGANFQAGATLDIDNANVFLDSTSVIDCGRVEALATIEPTATGVRPAEVGTFDVAVVNPDDVFGERNGAFEVLINPARFDVFLQPGPSEGRLDGRDWVALNRTIPSQEGVDPTYDPDLDLDGDGWVDGNELAYLRGSGVFGMCWSGTAWTIAACPAGQQ